MRTRGDAHSQTAHRSLWRTAMERRAGDTPLDDWLVEQANLRGWFGAYQANPTGAPADPTLTAEEIIVGLCQPHAPADARSLKLVVRIVQGGLVDAARLARLARQERADFVLYWLLAQIPIEERTRAVERVAEHFTTQPRGYAVPRFSWDPKRLIRRPVSRTRW